MGEIERFIIALVVVGALLFLLQRVNFIDDTVKLIIKVIVIVVIVIWAIKILLPMAGLS